MITFIVGVVAFGGGFAVRYFFGPRIDAEAGTIIHKGETFVKSIVKR